MNKHATGFSAKPKGPLRFSFRASFIRIATGSKAITVAEPLENTLAFCDRLLSAPASKIAYPAHWSIFAGLCRRTKSAGKLVPDAFLAAMAIERGAAFMTFDRDFNQFPGLTWRHPLDPLSVTNPR